MNRFIASLLFSTALLASLSANAALVTYNVGQTLNASNFDAFNLDVDHNGTVDFVFNTVFFRDASNLIVLDVINVGFGSKNSAVIDASTLSGFPTVALLMGGVTVSYTNLYGSLGDKGNLAFTAGTLPITGNFAGMSGFIGFRFNENQNSGLFQYGFAEISIKGLNDPNNPLGVTIGVISYNDTPGQAARIATKVPEPATLSLMGLGMLGFLVRCKLNSNR